MTQHPNELTEAMIEAGREARAKALFEEAYGMKLVSWSDETRFYWLGRADADIASQSASPTTSEDGSLTISNASVQRLMDYGLLHYTDEGWYVGTWPETNRPSASPATSEDVVERVAAIISFNRDDAPFNIAHKIVAALASPTPRDTLEGLEDALFDAIYDSLGHMSVATRKAAKACVAAIAALKDTQQAEDRETLCADKGCPDLTPHVQGRGSCRWAGQQAEGREA